MAAPPLALAVSVAAEVTAEQCRPKPEQSALRWRCLKYLCCRRNRSFGRSRLPAIDRRTVARPRQHLAAKTAYVRRTGAHRSASKHRSARQHRRGSIWARVSGATAVDRKGASKARPLSLNLMSASSVFRVRDHGHPNRPDKPSGIVCCSTGSAGAGVSASARRHAVKSEASTDLITVSGSKPIALPDI